MKAWLPRLAVHDLSITVYPRVDAGSLAFRFPQGEWRGWP
jgi:hypothetical protein